MTITAKLCYFLAFECWASEGHQTGHVGQFMMKRKKKITNDNKININLLKQKSSFIQFKS